LEPPGNTELRVLVQVPLPEGSYDGGIAAIRP